MIRRATKKSRPLTGAELLAHIRNGKLMPNDTVTDIANQHKTLNARKLIEKYGPKPGVRNV